MGSRKDSSVHAVDLAVLESMALPEDTDALELHHEDACAKTPNIQDTVDEEVEEDVCLICMGRFTKKRTSILIPCSKKCNLAPVHAKCIYEWKEQKKGAGTCPLCRSDLGEVDYRPPDLLQMHNLVMFNARKQFCLSPIPKGAGMVRCYIKARNGFWGSPIHYEMFVQAPTTLRYPLGVLPGADSPEKGDRLLLTAHKRLTKWGNSVIDISLDERGSDFSRSGPNYVGSVHASTSGLEHSVTMPFHSSAHGSNAGGHRELAAITYTQNRVGSASGPRRMQVALPNVKAVDFAEEANASGSMLGATPSSSGTAGAAVAEGAAAGTSAVDITLETGDEDDDDDDEEEDEAILTKRYVTEVYRPKGKADQMISILRKGRQAVVDNDDLVFGQNKEPYWLDSIQAYSLDFQGRVTLPSNKNFQLEIASMPEAIGMQFGKVVAADDGIPFAVYTVDLQWPLSPLQAFGICLSSCDRKLAVA